MSDHSQPASPVHSPSSADSPPRAAVEVLEPPSSGFAITETLRNLGTTVRSVISNFGQTSASVSSAMEQAEAEDMEMDANDVVSAGPASPHSPSFGSVASLSGDGGRSEGFLSPRSDFTSRTLASHSPILAATPRRQLDISQFGTSRKGGIDHDDITLAGQAFSPRRRGDVQPSQSIDIARLLENDLRLRDTGDRPRAIRDPAGAISYIAGSSISLIEVKVAFKDYLENFKMQMRKEKEGQEVNEEDLEPFYPRYLLQIMESEDHRFNLDLQNLLAYPTTVKLYHHLIKYPQEVLTTLDDVVTEVYANQFNRNFIECNIKVRPFNIGKSTNMRDLNPSDVDHLVSIKGLLIRVSPVIPEMTIGYFKCRACDKVVTVDVERGQVSEPQRCPRAICNSANTMALIHNNCEFNDKQICRLQETPDSIPDGQTPHTVTLCMYDDLVDISRPGDKLEITGVFRSTPIRVNPRHRNVKSLFKTYIDVVHIRKSDKRRIAADRISLEDTDVTYDESDEIRTIAEGDEARLIELSRRPDLYELLSRSLAPSIYEMDDVKKGILLQLFGGHNKVFRRTAAPRYRGDINTLLVGDPGTSKSQLLQYVHKIASRGVYTSGKGSSAVGLTAYVSRDPDTRQLVLESGALVLSDGGVCCIDEFDKMSEATRSVLHEVMEQQTVSVAKAGIITTLNARTSILASANPIHSKYNPKLSIVENIQLPPTLMSRFDLIYLVLDKVDENSDKQLAKHIVSLYVEDSPQTDESRFVPIETLTKYIAYARKHCKPKLRVDNNEAYQALVDAYVSMRKLGENPRTSEKIITATTRQLESMIRLSEAHARMKLAEYVELEDVQEAARLLREAIKQYAWDPETGKIDMDLINTGQGTHERRILEDIGNALQELLRKKGAARAPWRTLLRELNEQSDLEITERQFETAARTLEQQGVLKITGNGAERTITHVTAYIQ